MFESMNVTHVNVMQKTAIVGASAVLSPTLYLRIIVWIIVMEITIL